MTLSFGTDGIRGRAYDELTVAGVEALAIAAGAVLESDAIVIGNDTRESGPDFAAALARGFARDGVETWDLGAVPTPVVAHVAAEHTIAGVMVSASHNPYYDNGIKLFAPGGRKLTDRQQAAIEAHLARPTGPGGAPLATTSAPAPSPIDRRDLVNDYLDWVVGTVAPGALAGLRLVVDCANGAASVTAGDALARLGARVTTINDAPTGRNINDQCGSTHLDTLAARVVADGADIGIAFDGDADRLLAVDATGALVDGDQIIAICALDLHRRHCLADDTVVVTVMTNLGFKHGMQAQGIHVVETPVGDRHVLSALEANRWTLGGEQSGHVIFHELATTGDGLLSAIQLLDVVVRSGQTIDALAIAAMTRLPQRLRSIRVEGDAADALASIGAQITHIEQALGDTGRVLVRASGTEPLIRVMAEAPTQEEADAAVDHLVAALEAR